MRYNVSKGTVEKNGTRLTEAENNSCGFKDSIIPQTAEVTILDSKNVGDIETHE